MSDIRVLASGLVYRNPDPGVPGRDAWHPRLVLGNKGELIAAFDLGSKGCGPGYRTYISRSADMGLTWGEPLPLFDNELLDHPNRVTIFLARPNLMSNGQFVAVIGRFFLDDPDMGILNDENSGWAEMDLFFARSDDEGRTWQKPEPIAPPLVGPCFEVAHPPLELQDGRWLLPLATLKDWQGDCPDGQRAVAFVSHDHGKTWPEYIDVMDRHQEGVCYLEQGVTQLSDGRLLALAWAFDETAGATRSIDYAIGEGSHFGPPRPTPLAGETAKVFTLPDGRALCLYRGIEPAGLCASLVEVNGDQPVFSRPFALWQGAEPTMMFGERPPAQELRDLKLGSPHMVVLPNGEVLAAFWSCEQEVFNIRWLRLGVGAR